MEALFWILAALVVAMVFVGWMLTKAKNDDDDVVNQPWDMPVPPVIKHYEPKKVEPAPAPTPTVTPVIAPIAKAATAKTAEPKKPRAPRKKKEEPKKDDPVK